MAISGNFFFLGGEGLKNQHVLLAPKITTTRARQKSSETRETNTCTQRYAHRGLAD